MGEGAIDPEDMGDKCQEMMQLSREAVGDSSWVIGFGFRW